MPKLYSIRELELKPGVPAAQFEQFVRDEYLRMPPFAGLTLHMLRGERGVRTGKYVFLMEWDSADRWREALPQEGQASDEFRQWLEQHQLAQRLRDYAEVTGSDGPRTYTAYVDLAAGSPSKA